MRRIIASLPARIRVSRIFKGASFGFTAAEIQGHFECVQQKLNKTHIEACFLTVVTRARLNTAFGYL